MKVEGEPRGIGVCHCLACEHRTGSVFAAIAGISHPCKVTGQASEHVRTGDQSAQFRLPFCPVCGTNLFHTEEACEARGGAVAVGGFADPDFPPPQDSVYDCRRHSWVQLPASIRAHDKDPDWRPR